MRFARAAGLALALAAVGCIRVYYPESPPEAPSATPDARDDGKPGIAGEGQDTVPEEGPYGDWDEVVEDAEVKEGLFTLYEKRGDLFWEIRAEQLERDYLVVIQYSRGIGDYLLLGGLPLRRDVVRFRRRGDDIQLVLPQVHAYAEPGTGMARAVDLSYGASVLASLDIESVNDSTGAFLVNMKDALVSDWGQVSELFQLVLGASASLSGDRSAIESSAAFPTNVEIDVQLTYSYQGDRPIPTAPYGSAVPIGVHYSWLELPEPPMRVRHADDRVGTFVSARMNFSRDTSATFFERYVERWRLEKADPAAEVSEPVEPITFYLDHTIPERWRPYVRQGVEAWNAAFERAGFRNAVRALDAPDDPDWDPEDARYSTIRWITPRRTTFAIGPADADPRTGELLNADILVTASWVQAWRGDWERLAAPTEALRERERLMELYRTLDPRRLARLCFYAEGLEQRAAFVRGVLLARGVIEPGQPVPESFIGAAIVDLIMHEVGHTLGLRHNFKASSVVPYDRLHDPGATRRAGISGSVMDYNAVNVAVDRERQGDYFMRAPGPWDAWAIEYAYRAFPDADDPDAERAALDAIARRAARDPTLAYGTDEDALGGAAGVDPLTQAFDLGADPLRFARDRLALVAEVTDALEGRILADGESYARLRGAFNGVLIEKANALLTASRVVGGQYVRRVHRGDPGGVQPFEPVPARRQREALEFLAREGFAPGAFEYEPDLLNRLMPNRWLHWGASPFLVPIDYPIHEVVLGIQSAAMMGLLHPISLTRILDTEVKVPSGERPFRLTDLFSGLTDAVWSEIDGTGPITIDGFRRGLQRRYVDELIRILLRPLPGTPADARALARDHLSRLSDRIDAALAADRAGDEYTRVHLRETAARVESALEASMTARVQG